MLPDPARAAVFLDRDGTLIEDADYLVRPEQVRLIPGAAAAVRRLNERGIPVVVVTNQSAIARGMATEADLARVHEWLTATLAAAGARLDGIYYCPHHPDFGAAPYRRACACRKPLPGLLLQAADELGLDLAASAMIGDSLRDLEAGVAAGCGSLLLVRTGHGRTEENKIAGANLGREIGVHQDLAGAVEDVLGRIVHEAHNASRETSGDRRGATHRKPTDQPPNP